MASLYFKGSATSTAQVDTLTVGGTVETDDVFNIIITDEAGNAVTLATVAGSATIATVCTTIAAAFNASTDYRLTPITALAGATTVTLTADTAGVPFYCTVTTTENGGGAADAQTFVRTATTANSGPSDWNTALNWSTGSIPVNSDNVVIDSRNAVTAGIIYGLNQSAVTLASLDLSGNYKPIGTELADLRIGVTAWDIGRPLPDGSSPTLPTITKINTGTVQTAGTVHSTRTSGSNGFPPVQLKGTHASNAYLVKGTSVVGIGTATPGVATTALTLTVQDTAKVTVGSGVTLGTVNPEGDGSKTTLYCAATTINYGLGDVTTEGSGAITTATIGGAFVSNSSGTITNLHVDGDGEADFSQSTVARTVSNAFVYGENSTLDADNGVALSVTFTNGVDCLRGAKSTQVNYGDGVTVTASAP